MTRAVLHILVFIVATTVSVVGVRPQIDDRRSQSQDNLEVVEVGDRLWKVVPKTRQNALTQIASFENESAMEEEVPISPAFMKVVEKIPLRKCAMTKLKHFMRFLDRGKEYYEAALKLGERNADSKTAKFPMDGVLVEEGSSEAARGCDVNMTFIDCTSQMVASDWMILIDGYDDIVSARNSLSDDSFPGPMNMKDTLELTEAKKAILSQALEEIGYDVDKAKKNCRKEADLPDKGEQRACMANLVNDSLSMLKQGMSGKKWKKEISKQSSAAAECPNDTGGTCNPFAGCASRRGPTNCKNGKCLCRPGFCAVNPGKNGNCVDQGAFLQTEESVDESLLKVNSSITDAQQTDAQQTECKSNTGGGCRVFACAKSRGATECIDSKCMCRPGYCANAKGQCTSPEFDIDEMMSELWKIEDKLEVVSHVSNEGGLFAASDCALKEPDIREAKLRKEELEKYVVSNGVPLKTFMKGLQDACGHVLSNSELGRTLQRLTLETQGICKWDRKKSCKKNGECEEASPNKFCAEGHQCSCQGAPTPEKAAAAFAVGTILGGTPMTLAAGAIGGALGGPAGATLAMTACAFMPDPLVGAAVASMFTSEWTPSCMCFEKKCDYDSKTDKCVMKDTTRGKDSSNPFADYPPSGMKCELRSRGKMEVAGDDAVEKSLTVITKGVDLAKGYVKGKTCQLVSCSIGDIDPPGPQVAGKQMYGKVGWEGESLFNCASIDGTAEGMLQYKNDIPTRDGGSKPNTPMSRKDLLLEWPKDTR